MRLQLMTRWRSAAAALNRVSLANDELTRDSAVLPFCSSPRSSSLVLTNLTYLGVVLFLPLLHVVFHFLPLLILIYHLPSFFFYPDQIIIEYLSLL